MRKWWVLSLVLFPFFTIAAPMHGELKGIGENISVWHQSASRWLTPENYFDLELKKYDGRFYGVVTRYPDYNDVNEFDTLIDQLPDGRVCPMVFFHERWRRLPDVLALDEKLRNYGGCRDVFND